MKNFVRISVICFLWLLFFDDVQAQKAPTIKLDNFQDSITFVNLEYDIAKLQNSYAIALKFEAANRGGYDFVRVVWADADTSDIQDLSVTFTLNHTYLDGCYPLQILLYQKKDGETTGDDVKKRGADQVYYAWVLNKPLDVSFNIDAVGSDKSQGCLSHGADTLLIYFVQNDNPPRTSYSIHVSSTIPLLHTGPQSMLSDCVLGIQEPMEIDLDQNWVQACWANQEEGRRDSIWLIFTEATGVKGATVSVKMSCQYKNDQDREKSLNKETSHKETVYIFDKPDLRQIYRNGELPFPDTLLALPIDKQNFNICAPGSPQEFRLEDNWFYKYQTIVLGEDSPERFDTTFFKIKYYYTDDSVSNTSWLPAPDVTWQDVTGQSEYVDDTTLTFRRAGFYMMRMELANKCSGPLEVDTLWTSLVRKDNTVDEFYDDHFRYIQVYENLEGNLAYQGEDVFCLNVKDSVILVDRNRRKFYDVPPEYSLTIMDEDTHVVISEKEVLNLEETSIYRGGIILNEGDDAGNYPKVEHAGCDSTTVKLFFDKPGNYRVIWGRKGENCDVKREKEFVFHIGGVPEILNDTISKYCYNNGLAIADGKMYHCGPYEFVLPDLSNAFDSANRTIDSVRFQLTKGGRDTILTYTSSVPAMTFTFDSTGSKENYILVNIFNACGVSTSDSVGFFTPVNPDNLSIWRDSLPDNDTLCLNADHRYYLHGVLPENYFDSVSFSGGFADINGVSIAGGTGGFVGLTKDKAYGVIKHKTIGEFIETYRIRNKDFPQCIGYIKDTVWIVEAPDKIAYPNKILYCESMDTLETRILFEEPDTVFNRVQWNWTGGIAEAGKFPKFLFRADTDDTLHINTMQSAGCYHRDTVVFKPQVLPNANFAALKELCAPDILDSAAFRGFAAGGNLDVSSIQWSVYKNAALQDSLVYTNSNSAGQLILTDQSADSLGLIYDMQNFFDPRYFEFVGKDFCRVRDTLPVKVYKPRLTILKNDTLYTSSGGVYDFTDIQTNYLIKKDLTSDPLNWTTGFVSDGSFSGNTYILGTNDKGRDSLVFALTGKTYCGDAISDTLIVYIPRVQIHAHRDTICSNTTDYVLWGRTTGEFIDTVSLEWKIVNPSSGKNWGSLSPSPSIGTLVKYIPGSDVLPTDTVKIEVKGSYAGGISRADTILLWVNPAPEYTPLVAGDTLLSIGQVININRIKALDYKHISGLSATVSGWARVEHDTNIVFTNSVGDEKNNKITAQITLKGLPGCSSVTVGNLPMMDLVNPMFKFKYEPLDMCAGEEYGIDTLPVFVGDRKDRFTVLKWSIVSGGGRFGINGNDTVSYIAGNTGGIGAEEIKLEADKQFTAYDGTWQSSLRTTAIKRSLSINVHVEPSLGLKSNKDRDTLCRESNQIEITGGPSGAGAPYWVLVSPAFYGDSLCFNGAKLSENQYTFGKGEGETDTVTVTVNQGRCTQWAGVDKKIYLYKMKEILQTKLSNVEVCEGGEVTIHYPVSLPQKYYWSWTSAEGSLDTLDKGLSPVYRPVSRNQGEVQLHVIPHEGCQEEMTFSKVNVSVRPRVELMDQTVCQKVGNSVTIPIRFVQGSKDDISGIDWFHKGESVAFKRSTPSETEIQYILSASDILNDTLSIVAKVLPNAPCEDAYTYDTLNIILNGQPVIVTNGSPSICQGGELALLKTSGDLGWLKIENAVEVVWQNNGFGSFNEDSTFYLPGENSGTANLTVIAKGVSGCADQNMVISQEVKSAPVPDFSVISAYSCQNAQTELEASAVAGVTVAEWKWKIEGQSYDNTLNGKVIHTFQNDGDIEVFLQQIYSYAGTEMRCSREKTEAVVIYPEPQADFENITQVAKGQPVVIGNLSVPGEVLTPERSKWLLEGEINPISGPDLSYQFNYPGSVQLTLTVTTAAGCTDSKSGVITVVEPPVADFQVEIDSCGHSAVFSLNVSQLNQAEVWWDWGKGSGFEQDMRADLSAALVKDYDVAYKDTTYQVLLELRNAADTVQKVMPVRFISRLEADFEILPETSGCHEIYRKIALDIKGKTDEAYVDWGDGDTRLYFEANEVTILSHRFENTTALPLIDTIYVQAKNACFTSSVKKPIKVLPATISVEPAIVGNASPCYGLDDELKVRNASVGFDRADCQWAWKFEADAALSQANVDTATYSYLSPGKYKVTLWMKDRCNEDTASLWVDVRGNDSLYFDILSESYCTDQTVTLKFTQKGEPEFSDLRWTIYNPHSGQSLKAVADSTQLTYKFTQAGDYGVLLSGKAEGCEDRQILPLHINETPQAMISLINGSSDTGCEPLGVEFQAADGSSLSQMPRILWDFRNGVSSSELKEKVMFNTEGVYDVTLTLISDSGCVNTDNRTITVLHTPRISFVTNDSLFCTQNGNFEVVIDNTSEDINACRFEWFKKVGTGISESIANTPQISSLNFEGVAGDIELKLIAKHLQTGCEQSFVKTIIASEEVKAQIFKDVPNVCLDYPVYFASRSENATRVWWDMGDGNVAVDTSFEYSYDKVGDYTIKLVVANDDGCKDSVPMNFTVYPLPVADFVWKKNNAVPDRYPDSLNLPKIDNGGVDFTNYSTVNPDDWGTELYYRWDFGDSTGINTAKDPAHHFDNNGLYEVWLKVSTQYGCVDSVSSMVAVDAVKGLYLPTAFAPALPDEELGDGNDYRGSARFQPKGIGLYSYKIQIFDPWSGTCVWSSEALHNGQPGEYWDGKFNGADLPAGNYIWKVKAIFIDGTVWENEKGKSEGTLILIR